MSNASYSNCGFVLWLTGISGAGKTTLSKLTAERFRSSGHCVCQIDGDDIRKGLCNDLGFSIHDRAENVRRIAEVAKIVVSNGCLAIVSCISPIEEERRRARKLFSPGKFVEAYVDTPFELAKSRDVKGLYARAAEGGLCNFTGLDSPYQPPVAPEIHIQTELCSPFAACELIVEYVLNACQSK